MIGTALAQIADQLAQAGIAATIDPRNVNPPGAWVTLRTFDPDVLCSPTSGLLAAEVWLIAQDSGAPTAYAQLDSMLKLALAAIEASGRVEADRLELPSGGGPRPAYRIPITVHIEED